MSDDSLRALRMPPDETLRDFLAERVAADPSAVPGLRSALVAAQLAVAANNVAHRAGRMLDRGAMYRVSDVDGGGPELVAAADGEQYVVDASFGFDVTVTRLAEAECYVCYGQPSVEVYRGNVLCRDCSYDERTSYGDLVTVYEPCRDGDHADCIGTDEDEESRPLDLARSCACACHAAEAART